MATHSPSAPSSVNASSILPYTYGLDGVDMTMDNVTSRILYGTIGLICVIVTAVRLAQRSNAHMRHLFSLCASADQQAYWKRDQLSWWPSFKKNWIYAPLRHKRHNREIQLSAAVNVGTIPGRLATVLLVLYALSNVAYCSLLNYSAMNKAAILAELRGRSGHLSILNMIALFIMAGRNNPFIRILRVSFDTFNLFHRWIGRIVVIEALVHTFAWGINEYDASGMSGINAKLGGNAFIQWGMVGTVAMTVILFQSPSAVRHAFYETFLHVHQLMAFMALAGIFMHAKIESLPQMTFIIFIACIWSYDRLARLFRLVYHNISFTRGVTKVLVEALPGEACRLTFFITRPWTPRPGAHVYVYLPTVSLWQSHPFSVAWSTNSPNVIDRSSFASSSSYAAYNQQPYPATPTSTLQHHNGPAAFMDEEKQLSGLPSGRATVSLVTAARSGMTRSLYTRASLAPSKSLLLTGLLEGPYGSLESLHSYGTVLLFAGGVGITHQLGHVRDLLAQHDAGTAAIRRLTLVWTVRHAEQLEWARPWMDQLLAMPGRRELLRIQLFVTKPRRPQEIVSASERLQMFPGRPDASVLVGKEFGVRVGAMCVGVCGPGALADDVRGAAREVVGEGKCDFWEEGFTW